MITVAIIEDNRMVRDALSAMLNALPDVSVLHAADNAPFDALRTISPRLLLLSVDLPDDQCVTIASRTRDELGGCDVVVMDLSPEQSGIAQLVNVGAAGFILKDAPFEEYAETVRRVAAGDSVMPPRMLGSLFSQLNSATIAGQKQARASAVHLTPREQEITGLIAQGKSNKQIAMQLSIAAHTVKTHVRNVMEKLELNTRLQIAAYMHERSV